MRFGFSFDGFEIRGGAFVFTFCSSEGFLELVDFVLEFGDADFVIPILVLEFVCARGNVRVSNSPIASFGFQRKAKRDGKECYSPRSASRLCFSLNKGSNLFSTSPFSTLTPTNSLSLSSNKLCNLLISMTIASPSSFAIWESRWSRWSSRVE